MITLVARREERERLLAAWQHAQSGQGQIVLISGEPGIGKSRLIEALLEATQDTAHSRMLCACLELMKSSPLHPFINYLERKAEFDSQDTAVEKWTKLRHVLGEAAGHEDGMALIADMLRLFSPDPGRTVQMSPRQRKEKIGEVFNRHLTQLAHGQPALIVIEDLHWMDPTSLDLTALLLKQVVNLPVLLVMCFRPGFKPPWQDLASVTMMHLGPLSHSDSEALVTSLQGETRFSATMLREIVARTDGVPLYIEEMTAAVLEAEAQGEAVAGFVANVPAPEHGIPATLHASLSARLDRLGKAKAVAQLCAALGRTVPRRLLAAVSTWSPKELQTALRKLLDAGLLYREGHGKAMTYGFKHALVQDMAYSTMLRETRRRLHRRIVEVYEAEFDETVKAHPEILARHCAEAGLTNEAISYWRRAGFWALERSAMAEAIVWLEDGLQLIKSLPPTAERFGLELEFEIAHGKALIATVGYAAGVTGEAFGRARELCSRLGNPPVFLAVLHGQWTHALLRAEFVSAQRHVNELATTAEHRNDDMWMVMACRFAGVTYYPMGELLKARQNLERGLSLFKPQCRAAYSAWTVDDTRVVMLTYLSYTLLYLGEIDDARLHCHTGLTEAQALGQPYSITHALVASAFIELSVRRFDDARHYLQQLLQLTGEHGIAYYEAVGTLLSGACDVGQGRVDAGVDALERGVSAYRATGSRLYLPTFAGFLADAYRELGRYDLAEPLIEELIGVIEQTNMRNDESELYRLRGQLRDEQGNREAAQRDFQRARLVAEHQQSRLQLQRLARRTQRMAS